MAVRKEARAAGRPSRPHPGGKRSSAPALLGIGLVAALALAAGAVLVFEIPLPGVSLSVERVAETIRSWGAWGVVATIGLMVVHAFIPFPAECVALAAGTIYGPLWGTVITWAGAMCGAWLSFGLAKLFGRPLVERLVSSRHMDRIDRWAESQGAQTLLVARLMPVIAFNLINYGAGLTAISWWTFTWTTAIGILPLTALMVVAGDQMHQLSWVDGLLLSAAAVALWGLVYVMRRRSKLRRAVTVG